MYRVGEHTCITCQQAEKYPQKVGGIQTSTEECSRMEQNGGAVGLQEEGWVVFRAWTVQLWGLLCSDAQHTIGFTAQHAVGFIGE